MRLGIATDVDQGPDERFAFGPESKRWQEQFGAVLLHFDDEAGPRARAAEVNEIVEGAAGLNLEQVAFFCHGLRTSLQTGHVVGGVAARSIEALATSLLAALATDGVVTLYACSCGSERTDRPFARELARAMNAQGGGAWLGWIDAHTTAGHTTYNPMVRRFYASGLDERIVSWSELDKRGRVVRSPETRARFGAWRADLKTAFRWAFPRMNAGAIRARYERPIP